MRKSFFKISLVLFAVTAMLFTSCKKEYDNPPIIDLPVGTVYTISDILAMPSGTVFSDTASVYGIVTADEVSGNFYKMAFIQDRASGAALELYMDATSGVRIGDSIRVYLKGITYMVYNGLPQLSGFEPDGHIVILANGKPIEPAVTTIADINAGQHVGGLIKLENVKFTENTTFADPSTYGNRTLVDPANLSQSVIVRTSNYANFANDSLPQGTGNLIAIASVYGTTHQLLLRSVSELDFDGYNPGGGGVQALPYYQSFTSSFGTYTPFSKTGTQTWIIDYSTATMTGYDNSVYYANEDWLISSKVSLADVSAAKMTMTYIARYFETINSDLTVQVSTDYESGDPSTATWTAAPATWTLGSNWTDFATTDVDLTAFVGQTVTVAVKYLSTDTKAGTIEMQSIVIQEGSGGGGGGGGLGGSGTAEDPYTVASAISLQNQSTTGWVKGYIVGAVKSGISTVESNDQINWAAPFDLATNVLIADNASENDVANCVIVNLPAGSALRTQVNLMDNSGNLGKNLAVLGTLRTYFGQAGLRDSDGTESSFVLEGGGGGGGGGGTAIFSESFASGQGAFTIKDVVLPSALTYVWSYASSYSCMKASAYVSQSYESESWLVSPSISLAGVTSATLSFKQAVNYNPDPQSALSVMISTNYTGDVATATWTALNLSAWPSGSDWTFISSTADLSQYAGQSVVIAFKYTSTSSVSATWEVKSLVVE